MDTKWQRLPKPMKDFWAQQHGIKSIDTMYRRAALGQKLNNAWYLGGYVAIVAIVAFIMLPLEDVIVGIGWGAVIPAIAVAGAVVLMAQDAERYINLFETDVRGPLRPVFERYMGVDDSMELIAVASLAKLGHLRDEIDYSVRLLERARDKKEGWQALMSLCKAIQHDEAISGDAVRQAQRFDLAPQDMPSSPPPEVGAEPLPQGA
jgi:hypothetical protein